MFIREWFTVARGLADRGQRGAANLFHQLAVELAEEGDRQAAVLDAASVAVDGGPGELMTGVDASDEAAVHAAIDAAGAAAVEEMRVQLAEDEEEGGAP